MLAPNLTSHSDDGNSQLKIIIIILLDKNDGGEGLAATASVSRLFR